MLWRDETIAAISTPLGEGGIGIVRVSGNLSLSILRQIFVGIKLSPFDNFEPRRVYNGFIKDVASGDIIDEAVVFYMKAPHSYTCEDVVEIQCHGSFVSVRKILDLVLRCGGVMAQPGEFTLRAFLNGRIDLSQAEAVMDLIKAKSEKASSAAVSQLNGGLSDLVHKLRDDIDDIVIMLIANIEYPEEDLEEYDTERLIDEMVSVKERIDDLSRSAETGKILREGLRISLVGRPNVGKSSIMNSLLRESRVIVTDLPGTTRDVIEESIDLNGIPVVLSDTAGIRDTDDRIEMIGIEKTRSSIDNSDLIFFIIDSSNSFVGEDYDIIELLNDLGKKYVVISNKSDLKPAIDDSFIREMCPRADLIHTSTKTGGGIAELENYIMDNVGSGSISGENRDIFCNIRHKMILDQSSTLIESAINSLKSGYAYDFAESDIREARDLLGEIIGESVDDNIIEKLFSRFCLGK